MKQPLRRHETALYAVANASKPRHANGKVVNGRVQKHEPYRKAKLAAPSMTGYKLPVGGFR